MDYYFPGRHIILFYEVIALKRGTVPFVLAGVCLLLYGTYSLLNQLRSILAYFSYNLNISLNVIAAIVMNLALLLCGLFLVLRKPKAAAAMAMVAAVMRLSIPAILYMRSGSISPSSLLWSALLFLSLLFFAIGLFGRGAFALVMCILGASLGLANVARNLIQVFNLSFDISLLTNYFFTLHLYVGMILAGIALLLNRKRAVRMQDRAAYPGDPRY